MTIKLNDLQRVILSAACQTEDRRLNTSVHDNIDAARYKTAIASLVRRKLLAKVDAPAAGNVPSYLITDAGLEAIDRGEGASAPVTMDNATEQPDAPQTKTALVVSLMKRTEGATLDQMVAATGWLPHTTRAALTGLRKRGHAVARTLTDDGSVYRIGAAA